MIKSRARVRASVVFAVAVGFVFCSSAKAHGPIRHGPTQEHATSAQGCSSWQNQED